MTPLRILFVVGAFPELTFVLRTITALAARGHQVSVAARRQGSWRALHGEPPLPRSVRVHYLLPDSGLLAPGRLLRLVIGLPLAVMRQPAAAIRLLRRCRSHPALQTAPVRGFIRHVPFLGLRADVVQFDFPMTHAGYPLLSEILGAPTVVSCRGTDVHMLEQRDPANREARLSSLRGATALHCVSDEMAGEVRRLAGRSDGVWVNRPAVPADRIRPREAYPASPSPCIIAVGRLTWKKGYDYLLAALARLKQAGHPFQAQIIGSGELHAVLRFSIGDLDLADRVTLTGALPPAGVLARLAQADVFVLSSHQEGIANAALEAMACGLPVVTTNAGGMAEVVRDGVEGFVVPVRDIGALADRIARLLADPALRERMGRAARARVEAAFTLERQAHAFEELYRAVVPGPREP